MLNQWLIKPKKDSKFYCNKNSKQTLHNFQMHFTILESVFTSITTIKCSIAFHYLIHDSILVDNNDI